MEVSITHMFSIVLLALIFAFNGVEGAVLVAKPNDGVGYSHNIHSMICVAFGYPLPQFTWQKGSTTINPQSDPSIYVNTTSVTTSDGTLFAVSILTFCALRMTDAGTYRCNVISNPNDQYSFLNGVQSATFSLTVTIEPPQLNSFSMDMDHGRLALSFSKPISIATFKPVITLQNLWSNPTASVTLTNNQPQSTVDTGYVVIVLSSSDLDAVKSTRSLYTGVSDSYLSYTTGGTQSSDGGYLPLIDVNSGVQVSDYTADLTRPAALTVDRFDLDSGSFDVTFTEPIDPMSINPILIALQNKQSNPTQSYNLVGVSASTLNTVRNVRMRLSLADIQEVKTLPDLARNMTSVLVAFSSSSVQDYAGNQLISNTLPVNAFIPDTSPAGLICFNLDMNYGSIGLSFDDVVSQPTLRSSRLVLQSSRSSASGYQVTMVDGTPQMGQTTFIQIDIPINIFFNIKTNMNLGTSTANTYISASQAYITDIYNTPSREVPTTNATQACQFIEDTTSPVAFGFSLDFNQGGLLLSFDEPILPSSFVPSGVFFRSSTTNLPVLSGGDVSPTSNASVLRISLTSADLTNIYNDPIVGSADQPDMTMLQLNANSFTDFNANPVSLTNLNAQMITPDTAPPTLAGFSLNLVSGVIIITFSEPIVIDNQDQFINSISITDNPNTPTFTVTAASTQNPIQFQMTSSNVVTLTMPPDLHQLIDNNPMIATSTANIHLSFGPSVNVKDLVGLSMAPGFTTATGIVRLCLNNTYNDVNSGTCESCPSVCREGCTGSTPNVGTMGCQRCELLQVDSSNNPIGCFNPSDGCPVGTYRETDVLRIQPFQGYLSGVDRSVCFSCDSRCAQCSGSSVTTCTACSHAAVKVQTGGVMCLDTCAGNNNCYYCDAQCNGCRNNATDCVACRGAKMSWQGRDICVPTCTANQYLRILPSGKSQCVDCDPQCNGCTGATNADCKVCRNYTMPTSTGSRKMCVSSCGDGYYSNATSYCLPCSRDCRRCSGPASSQCFVCQFEDASVDRVATVDCLRTCPPGYVLDVEGGDCDLNTAAWLVPMILLFAIAGCIVVALIVAFFWFRRSKQKSVKNLSDPQDFAHNIDNPVYSKSDTGSMAEFES